MEQQRVTNLNCNYKYILHLPSSSDSSFVKMQKNESDESFNLRKEDAKNEALVLEEKIKEAYKSINIDIIHILYSMPYFISQS